MPAATEHRQVTEMSANIVFVNIDWKEAMMHKTLSNNLERLSDTIKDVVSMMQPTMICMCEVGVTSDLLSQHQMQIMADAAIRTRLAGCCYRARRSMQHV